jgi:hypothetical protein
VSFSDVLFGIGAVPVAIGWSLWFVALKRSDKYLDWLSTGLFALGFWIWFIADAIQGNRAGGAIQGLFALWNTYLWWKNRRNRKRGKAGLALGAKTRAIIEEMTAKLKPSPIPSPTGA